ncbi:hypothetical protein [Streptomyces sp. SA15]|uniref:hypothetical protein n=1 Tax=Streptomyces sp. SA15 TaxID=934019 RepID=UPI001180FC48|nr:hypothetical protein [Streptomyces sp. SA15]
MSKDESPEVVAAALRQLWPTHIALAEFLSSVRDPDPQLIGRAYMLRREFPELINVPELDEAITWARDTLCDSEDSRSRALVVSLLGRAITLAGQEPLSDAVLSNVTEALLGLAGQHEFLFSQDLHTPLQDLAEALGREAQTRRSLAELLITRASAEQFLALHVGRVIGSLLPSADALYWMEHWDLLSAADEQVSRLAVAFPPPEERTVLERAQAARASHPTLRAATAFWDNPPAESPWEREHRELREAERRQNTYDETALRAALDAVLTTAPDQLRSAWAGCQRAAPHSRRFPRQLGRLMACCSNRGAVPAVGRHPAGRPPLAGRPACAAFGLALDCREPGALRRHRLSHRPRTHGARPGR